MDLNVLCKSCFTKKGDAQVCPNCGFDGKEESGPTLYLQPGNILENKYMIGRVLGQGGFGITYLAWDINLNVKLAIKEYFPQQFVTRESGKSMISVVSGSLGHNYSYGLEKFLQEARTLAQFEGHPNIVSVRDYFQANGTAYFVMSYVEGLTLQQYLNNSGGKLPFHQAKSFIMPVLDALKEIHAVNILHRDISPDNIFINDKGQIILLDFGAARQAASDQKSLSIILKPGYAPEEQYRSRGKQGPWTDIYAVAATLYRLITGWQPPEALERLTNDTLASPRRIGVDISTVEEEALLKAISVRAQDRFQAVEDFQAALMGEVAEKVEKEPENIIIAPVYPQEAEEAAPSPPPQPDPLPFPESVPTPEPKSEKKPLVSILIGLAAVLLLAIAALALVSSGILSDQTAAVVEEPEETGEIISENDEATTPFEEEAEEPIYESEPEAEPEIEPVEDIVEKEQTVAEPEEVSETTTAKAPEPAAPDPVVEVKEITDTSGLVEGVIRHDGGTYTGQLLNGVPHGHGIWSDNAGNRYFGQWRDGKPNGQGERNYPNGDFYKGNMANGFPNGQGYMRYASGLKYEGGFKNGQRHGMGKLIYPDGSTRIDEWDQGNVKN